MARQLESEKPVKLPFFAVVQDVFKCPVCDQFYNNPVQTSCGHRFCEGCFNIILRDKEARCPVDQQTLSPKEVFYDMAFNKQLAAMVVPCSFSAKGCDWSGSVHKLEDHNRQCMYQEIFCPKGCGKKVIRKELKRHAASADCIIALTRCKICFMEVAVDRLKHHHCPHIEVSTTEDPETIQDDMNKQVNRPTNHLNGNLGGTNIPCKFTNVRCNSMGISTYLQTPIKRSSEEPNNISTTKSKLNDTKIQQQGDTLKKLQETCSEQCMLLKTSEAKQDAMQRKIDNQDFVISEKSKTQMRLEKEIEQMRSELTSCRNDIDELKYGSQNGTLLWRIDHFSRHLDNALNRKTLSMFSRSIYTSKYGYKVCAQLFPGGTGDSFGQYVSIYFHLMPTDHDEVLKWPFSHKITFTLLDQVESGQDGQNISYTLTPAPGAPNYQKPTGKMSEGRGYHKFISHEKLQNGTYVKNDTMFIKIKVNGKSKE